MKILNDESLKSYSNMRVGGIAKTIILVEKQEELRDILKKYEDIFLLGNGTNILFSDGRIEKTFVCLKNLKDIKLGEDGLVEAQAGVNIKSLLDFMEANNFSGIESLTGIPGSLGGLIYMNGGAFGQEIFDCIESVKILNLNGEIEEIKKENIKYSYRHTEFQDSKSVIISAKFKFNNNFDSNRVKEIKELRESKHPLDKPSLGSTFKNPNGDFAARLISECNLKGFSHGNARISEKHPNFVLNMGGASFEDIMTVVNHAKQEVKKKFNIDLEEEIIVVK